MSQKASTAAIGAFVLGAIALMIVAVLSFGSGRFLKETQTFVLYFQGNARGLNIGAPASFRGVKMGTVNQIQLLFDKSTDEVYVGVVVEIEKNAFYNIQSQPGVDKAAGKVAMNYLINDLGLRAKLATLSLVTGQLYIEFDFYPDSPVKLYGFDFPYNEFPTLPSTMEEMQGAMQRLLRAIEQLPIEEIFGQLRSSLDGFNKFINSPGLQEAPEVFHQGLINIRDLSAQLKQRITPLALSLQNASDEAGAAMADVRLMLRYKDSKEVVHLAESLDSAAVQARDLLVQGEDVVSAIDGDNINDMIREISEAARSLRLLADYLERHPEALIRGKN